MQWTRSTIATASIVLAVVLFFSLNVAANIFFRSARLDLTSDGLYTVSKGTINTLRSLPEPVTLRFFFSERLAAQYVGLRAYGARVRDLLQEYAAIAGDKVKLEVIDPEPLTEQEDLAVAQGISGAPIEGGDTFYFGLVGTNMINGREVIPFFVQDREKYLEYDLTNLIYRLTREKKPKIGVVSNLPLDTGLGGMAAAMQGRSQPFMIYEQMRETYDVQFLEQDFDRVPADIDVVMIAHPKPLNQRTLYALDQFIMRGGRALVFLDPLSELSQVEADPQGGPLEGSTSSSAASIEPLMKQWGVQVDPKYVIGDLQRAQPVSMGQGGEVGQYVLWLALKGEDMDRDDLVTGDLNSLNLGSVGAISTLENHTTTITPIIKTTKYTMEYDVERARMSPNPDELMRTFAASGDIFTVGARITGPVKSAFPNGPPPESMAPPPAGQTAPPPLPAHLKETKGQANIILLADSDIFNDSFWVQPQELMGQRVAVPVSGNADFVLNSIGNLTGSDDLISLRSRGTSQRPFEVVNNIRRNAEQRFLREEERLQTQMTETQNRIAQLEGRRSAEGRPGEAKPSEVLTPEQKAEIEKFRAQLVETRTALRDVQHKLRNDIDRLGNWLAAINILLVPLMLVAAAIGLAMMRGQTRKPDGGAA